MISFQTSPNYHVAHRTGPREIYSQFLKVASNRYDVLNFNPPTLAAAQQLARRVEAKLNDERAAVKNQSLVQF